MGKILLATVFGLSFIANAVAAEPVTTPAAGAQTAMPSEDCTKIMDAAAKKECEDKAAKSADMAKPATK